MPLPMRASGTSRPVITAYTPGSVSAADVSMETMRAWACRLRSTRASSMPASRSPPWLALGHSGVPDRDAHADAVALGHGRKRLVGQHRGGSIRGGRGHHPAADLGRPIHQIVAGQGLHLAPVVALDGVDKRGVDL